MITASPAARLEAASPKTPASRTARGRKIDMVASSVAAPACQGRGIRTLIVPALPGRSRNRLHVRGVGRTIRVHDGLRTKRPRRPRCWRRGMPIKFRCPLCEGMLSIAKRKAGTQVVCPKCGDEVTVPDADLAAGDFDAPDETEVVEVVTKVES